MASNDKSEDEILGLESMDSSKELGTDSNRADEEISCIDEELLLLNSPSPHQSPNATNSSTSPKSGPKPTANTSHGISDNDDELEIIDDDDDDVEEITDLNDISDNSDSDELDEMSDESELESEESTTFLEGKINIFFCHGAFFLWNADDVQMLREECRIIGKLTGSLPRAPRQNNHLGLPLQLMPEEVKLLVDIDAAVVVEEEPVSDKILRIREAAFQNVRATNYKIQQKLYKENRKNDVKQRLGDIIAGKKAKKRKLKTDRNGEVADTNTEHVKKKIKTDSIKANEDVSENEGKTDSDDHLTVDDIISETANTSEKHALVQIFTENPWKRNLRPYTMWTYPSTERETIRYQVFKDLWGKGFYLTSGAKFGGDFLVYPGDPARFHSHYIAICKNQAEELPCLDIITYGRQASNVRKTALLCSVDRSKKVFYTSLQWTGIS